MIPAWKKYLSYLTEIHLESTSSVFNPHLYVSLSKGRLMLSTDKAVYSYADKYENFAEVLKKVDFRQYSNCLILGFGLGSIPYIIEKNLNKNLSYTGVEIDEEVIYLASKYVIPFLKSEIEVIHADAIAYTNLTENQYDLIMMDVFESDYIPTQFEEVEFIERLSAMVSAGGLVFYNRLANTIEDLHRSLKFFENSFSEVFPEATYLRIKGNLMLMSRPIN
jgi:spermidine synthase